MPKSALFYISYPRTNKIVGNVNDSVYFDNNYVSTTLFNPKTRRIVIRQLLLEVCRPEHNDDGTVSVYNSSLNPFECNFVRSIRVLNDTKHKFVNSLTLSIDFITLFICFQFKTSTARIIQPLFPTNIAYKYNSFSFSLKLRYLCSDAVLRCPVLSTTAASRYPALINRKIMEVLKPCGFIPPASSFLRIWSFCYSYLTILEQKLGPRGLLWNNPRNFLSFRASHLGKNEYLLCLTCFWLQYICLSVVRYWLYHQKR